jgi:hypothetical protein
MSASGINFGWHRDYFIRAGICPCDPCAGQECRLCSGQADDERELWLAARDARRAER